MANTLKRLAATAALGLLAFSAAAQEMQISALSATMNGRSLVEPEK